jgi:pSer/pThr/pTyr-binding forkhead associated (FHA) protein/DNA-binding CsgD family transcriptional regulator
MDAEPFTPHRSTPAELQERIAAERTGTPFLLYRDDAGSQQIVMLGEECERVTVGRHADNDLPLPWDAMVSRVHAVLEPVAGSWTVADDGLSRNGTWIGQDRVTGRRRLQADDVLRIGRTQIAFRDPRQGTDAGSTQMGSELQTAIELTRAQKRVLVALCRPLAGEFGHPATNQEIADELAYSVDAVKTHLRTLFRKFAIGDLPQNQKRQQLAERARRFGIVTDRDLQEDPAP